MTDSEFWKLIALVDQGALERNDGDAAMQPLQKALAGKNEAALVEFEEVLAQKLYAIDGQAYAQNAGELGSSDDAFLYARLYVVAKGEEYYKRVRSHPERMSRSIQRTCEPLLYVHRHAWKTVTGRPAAEWPFTPSVSYATGSNAALWER
jgi:hypothetical protein